MHELMIRLPEKSEGAITFRHGQKRDAYKSTGSERIKRALFDGHALDKAGPLRWRGEGRK